MKFAKKQTIDMEAEGEIYDVFDEDIMELPIVMMRGLTDFSGEVKYFDIGREKSVKAIEEAMIMNRYIFIAPQNDNAYVGVHGEFGSTGTIARVKKIQKSRGDSVRILVEGLCAGEISRVIYEEPYYKGVIQKTEENPYFVSSAVVGAVEMDADVTTDAEMNVGTASVAEMEAAVTGASVTSAADGEEADILGQFERTNDIDEKYEINEEHDEYSQKVESKRSFKEKLKSMKKKNIAAIVVVFLLAIGGISIIGSQVSNADSEHQIASRDRKTTSISSGMAKKDTETTATTEETTTEDKSSYVNKRVNTKAKTTTTAHQHTWVPVYTTDTRTVIYFTQVPQSICNDCKADVTGNETQHAMIERRRGRTGIVVTTFKQSKISKEEPYQYISGYKCSCGATK